MNTLKSNYKSIIKNFGTPKFIGCNFNNKSYNLSLTYNIDLKDITRAKQHLFFGEIAYKYHNAKCSSAKATFNIKLQNSNIDSLLPGLLDTPQREDQDNTKDDETT